MSAPADPVTERDLASIPKVELHVHLGGSITEPPMTFGSS
jgi:hypothetical protein